MGYLFSLASTDSQVIRESIQAPKANLAAWKMYPHMYPSHLEIMEMLEEARACKLGSNVPGPPNKHLKTSTDVFFCARNSVSSML
jgi:hypothetical protein